MYDTKDEARMRLKDSIITYRDLPMYVSEVYTNVKVRGRPYNDNGPGDAMQVNIASPLVDLTPRRLGYLNRGRSAYYLTRIPVRRYKQGLNPRNCRALPRNVLDGVNVERILYSGKGMIDLWRNEYPEFGEVVTKLFKSKAEYTQAFHREWALCNYKPEQGKARLTGGLDLLYKARVVGKVTKEGQPKLKEEYQYLNEALEEAIYE